MDAWAASRRRRKYRGQIRKMTIAQYASKWAVVEHKAECRNKPLWDRYGRQQIFFNWAVDDLDSPIRKAIDAGASEEMMSLLARMEGDSNAHSDEPPF